MVLCKILNADVLLRTSNDWIAYDEAISKKGYVRFEFPKKDWTIWIRGDIADHFEPDFIQDYIREENDLSGLTNLFMAQCPPIEGCPLLSTVFGIIRAETKMSPVQIHHRKHPALWGQTAREVGYVPVELAWKNSVMWLPKVLIDRYGEETVVNALKDKTTFATLLESFTDYCLASQSDELAKFAAIIHPSLMYEMPIQARSGKGEDTSPTNTITQ
jgi:hypothetical protein